MQALKKIEINGFKSIRSEQKKSWDPEIEIGGKNMNIVATPKKRG